MSVAEFEQAVEENGGEAFDLAKREAEERDEPPEDTGPYRIFLGGVPAEDEAMGTFFFKDDRLRFAKLGYVFLPHMIPPGLTEAECNIMFDRIGSEIEAVYGPASTEVTSEPDPNMETTVTWTSDSATVIAYKYIDRTRDFEHPGTPRCGVIDVRVFTGTEEEQAAFEAELDAFVEEQSKKRNSPAHQEP